MGMQGIEVLSDKLEQYFNHSILENTEERVKGEISGIDVMLVEQSYFLEKKEQGKITTYR